MPVIVETEATGNDRQPGSEATATIVLKAAQPPKAVFLKSFQHECVRVHRPVMLPEQVASDVNEQPTVLRDKLGPRRFPAGRIRRTEQALESEGQ